MQIAYRCTLLTIASGAENLVLQALQFQYTSSCPKFPGGAGLSHYGPNECFVEG
jgi:hypothetical protein